LCRYKRAFTFTPVTDFPFCWSRNSFPIHAILHQEYWELFIKIRIKVIPLFDSEYLRNSTR